LSLNLSTTKKKKATKFGGSYYTAVGT
jgi:hypothetical protein